MSLARESDYRVHLTDAALTGSILPRLLVGRRVILVTTPTVASLYKPAFLRLARAHKLQVRVVTLTCREETKTLRLVEALCERSVGMGLSRSDVLLGMGGGVCLDIVTVAASMLRRGVAHVRLPTTLVGQIDAGIGLKGAVNFSGRKNFLGSFWPPTEVVVDPAFLASLPTLQLRQGIAEIIKIAILRDPGLFALLLENHPALMRSRFQQPRIERDRILLRSAELMLDELSSNPYEDRTHKRLVDFGHTFSPALEAATGFTMPHGDAVAVDIGLSATLALELGLMNEADRNDIVAALRAMQLPAFSPLLTPGICATALQQAAEHRGGKANLVVPTGIGSAVFLEDCSQLPTRRLESAVNRLAAEESAGRLRRAGGRRQVGVEPDRVSGATAPGSRGASVTPTPVLVFDVGGTRLRAALYDPSRDTLATTAWAPSPSVAESMTANGSGTAGVFLEMRALANGLLHGREPDVVSVAFAGPIDGDGNLLAAPTLGLRSDGQPFSLLAALRRTWPGAQVTVLNDVTAAGYRYVSPRCLDFCIVTVSSGIGNKVFVSGRPLVGPKGRGGEIGHIKVDNSRGAPRCDCGERGHLGAIASRRGALRAAVALAHQNPARFSRSCLGPQYGREPWKIDNDALLGAFHEGDTWAGEVIRRAARPLGQTLATAHALAGIERFILVGGFALELGEAYRLEVVRGAGGGCWSLGQDWDRMITLGEPDDFAGLIGAGRFAVDRAEAALS